MNVAKEIIYLTHISLGFVIFKTDRKIFGLWLVSGLHNSEYKRIVSKSITSKYAVVKSHSNSFINFYH